MGSEIGIVTGQLATRFEHVTASDPSSYHISLAPSFMSSHFMKHNVRFLECRAEDASKLGASSVDLITMASAAYLLSTDGTFAAWTYDVIPRVVSHPVDELDETQTKVYELFDAFVSPIIARRGKGPAVKLFSDLLDLGFNASDWKDVRTLHWKRHRQFGPWITKMLDEAPVPGGVRPWETVEEHEESCMVAQDVDMAWLRRYLDSLYPEETTSEICPEELAALVKAMENGKRVDLGWTTSLVLVTRRWERLQA